MEFLGKYENRSVYWWNYSQESLDELKGSNWICFAIQDQLIGFDAFSDFAKTSIDSGVLEFKAFGPDSSELDDWFDEVIVDTNVFDKSIDETIVTTWHDNEELADAFWQCFHATCLPSKTDYENLRLVCFHFNGKDLKKELKEFILKFKSGFVPE